MSTYTRAQVQGRFATSSEGEEIYIGMEVPHPVVLGMLTKSLAKIILALVCLRLRACVRGGGRGGGGVWVGLGVK